MQKKMTRVLTNDLTGKCKTVVHMYINGAILEQYKDGVKTAMYLTEDQLRQLKGLISGTTDTKPVQANLTLLKTYRSRIRELEVLDTLIG